MNTKTEKRFHAFILFMFGILMLNVLESCAQSTDNQNTTTVVNQEKSKKKTIKIALLLDTSNSMDGLIEQAKSQLWTIVNELAKATCDGSKPDIKIALYEYGNSGLNPETGYIRQVTELTADLDKLSQDLFSLKTNGGDEFCGHVIHTATNQLQWNIDGNDLQAVFIAGNEPFNQGTINYSNACVAAKNKKIIVNTIFCGNFNEGISSGWKNGADLTGGAYMSIEQNTKTVFIETPYDDKISALNDSLNDTYIGFGIKGKEKKMLQSQQDKNAESYSKANKVNRAVTKSSYLYKNESWDLVDAQSAGNVKVEEIKEEELPQEMQKMDTKERKQYIDIKSQKREKINKQIAELNQLRNQYIAKQSQAANTPNATLDNAMIEAVRKQAIAQNFVFEK
ncbi:MAG: hypothetical protein RLZZ175_3249 [Bacteroidota bacterium]|jgi:hypothetical protein